MGGLDVLIIYSVCVVPLTVFSVGLFFFLSLSLFFFFAGLQSALQKGVSYLFSNSRLLFYCCGFLCDCKGDTLSFICFFLLLLLLFSIFKNRTSFFIVF